MQNISDEDRKQMEHNAQLMLAGLRASGIFEQAEKLDRYFWTRFYAGCALAGELASYSTEASCEAMVEGAAQAGRTWQDHLSTITVQAAERLVDAIERHEGRQLSELARWQHYASYLHSAVRCGEYNVHSFEEFVARTYTKKAPSPPSSN